MKLCQTCHKNFPDDATACPEHGDKLKSDPLIGTMLGSFKVEGWLGEGGMGILYKAVHTEIGRRAAVKVIKREFITDLTMAGRFEQEARAVAKIGHPHLIDIFDIGTTPDERIYYVMELLEGISLNDKMLKKPLSFGEFAPIIRDACEALEAAHAVGIVHRDLKPDNLFLIEREGEPPFVKLLDFGVAKVLGTDEDVQSKLTRTGSIVGTPQYMAPEQIDGSKVDARADVYAMGVILYELSTGTLPFKAETLGGMLKAHLMDVPPIFEEGKLAPGVPLELEAVAFKAMSKKRDDRYASVKELREDLERVISSKAPEATKWWTERVSTGKTNIDTLPGFMRASLAGKFPTVDVGKPGTLVVNAPKKKPMALYVAIGLVVVAIGPVMAVLNNSKTKEQPKVVIPVDKKPTKPKGPDLPAIKSKALAVVTAALKDGDPAVRKAALDALASGRDPRHRTLIEPLLNDADTIVQAAAATCLAGLGSHAACTALRNALGKDAGVDVSIAEALVKLGDEDGKKRLKDFFKKGDEIVRFRAALALADQGDKDAQKILDKKLLTMAPTDPIGTVILGHLAKGGEEAARATLATRLEGGEPMMQVAVAEALARLGDDAARQKLVQIAGQEGPARLRAYRILASLDDQSGYDVFQTTFKDTAAPIEARALAASGMGASGEKSALEILQPALEEQEPQLRLAAAGGILAIIAADPKALAAKSLDWATAALGDESWVVREQAAAVLGDADPKDSLPLLGKAMHDTQPEVRRAVVAALGKSKSSDAVPILAEALDDTKDEVRMGAIRSLGKVGDKSAAPILAKHFSSGKASAKEKVVAAGQMAKLGDKSHVADIKGAFASDDAEVRQLAVEESSNDAEASKDAVQVALKDKSFAVRLAAASQLADKGSKDGVDVLQEAVKKGGPDGLHAYAALEKLGVQPKSEVDPGTLLDAKDPEVRASAVASASSLPAAKQMAFLKRAFKDPDPRVRRAAIVAMGEIGQDPKQTTAALAFLKHGLDDNDPAVEAQSAALLSKLAPPEIPVDQPKQNEVVKQVAQPDMAPPPRPPDMTPLPVDMVPPVDFAAEAYAKAQAEKAKVEAESNNDESVMAMTSGELHLRGGKYQEAISDFNRAHHMNGKLPVFFDLGEAYRKLADRETDANKRKEQYKQAIANYQRSHDKKAAKYATELQDLIK